MKIINKNVIENIENELSLFFTDSEFASQILAVYSTGYGKSILEYDALTLIVETLDMSNFEMSTLLADITMLDYEIPVECIFANHENYENAKLIWSN